MKGTKERPPIAAVADTVNTQAHYSQDFKHFTGIRNDLNKLISLQEQTNKKLAELTSLNRNMSAQLIQYRGGQS
jgi:hypothetical protein